MENNFKNSPEFKIALLGILSFIVGLFTLRVDFMLVGSVMVFSLVNQR